MSGKEGLKLLTEVPGLCLVLAEIMIEMYTLVFWLCVYVLITATISWLFHTLLAPEVLSRLHSIGSFCGYCGEHPAFY